MGVKKTEDYLQGVWFAAGIAALMACLKRATMVSLVEQWRVWVFLALNLLLLAILFTSTSSTKQAQESNTNVKPNEVKRKKKKKQCTQFLLQDEQGGDDLKLVKSTEIRTIDEREVVEDDDVKEISLSKEELNEKVEAFIAMFRQHLVSDAKSRSWSPSQTRRKHPGRYM